MPVDFALTAEQELMRDSTRRLVAREIEPLLANHPADRSLPKPAFLHALACLADLGLTAVRLPEALGGMRSVITNCTWKSGSTSS